MREISIKNMMKVRCPHCGASYSAFYKEDAICRGVFFRCKNPSCRKQFELKI